jgi:cell wall-associated NlpC family hydrolase
MAVRAEQSATSSHVVQPGETLWQIAADAGTDSAALAALNGLDDANVLAVGQTLKLPGGAASALVLPPPPPSTYTVVDGDTLWAVAHQFGTTTAALAQLNSLDDPDHVALGTVLTLPDAAPRATPDPPAPPVARPPGAPTGGAPARRSLLVPYTVQAGETLTGIAHQFDVPTATIAQASGLDEPNKLSMGSVLKVPLPGKEHVVTAGETLRDIAAAEKVDLGSLIDFNQLDDPELIRVGQVVLVPVPATQQAATSSTAAAVPAPAPGAAAATTQPSAPPSPPPASAPAPAPAAARPAAPKPATPAPVAVVAPPRGSPTDGLAGAGLKLLGAPYVFGGSSPSGFDCSGFVWYVARQTGKSISRGMLGEYNAGPHPARDELKPGDLVFFQNTYTQGLSHNGIYIGNGQFVHAADGAAGVTVSSLNTAFWTAHWFGATRLP